MKLKTNQKCLHCQKNDCECPERRPDGSWDFNYAQKPMEDRIKKIEEDIVLIKEKLK